MKPVQRDYIDGWRRVPPAERFAGLTELRIPNTERCIQVQGYGPEADAAVLLRARSICRG